MPVKTETTVDRAVCHTLYWCSLAIVCSQGGSLFGGSKFGERGFWASPPVGAFPAINFVGSQGPETTRIKCTVSMGTQKYGTSFQ